MDLQKFMQICCAISNNIAKNKSIIRIHSDSDSNLFFEYAVNVAYGLNDFLLENVHNAIEMYQFNCNLALPVEAISIIDVFREIAEAFYQRDYETTQCKFMFLKGYCEA